MNFGESQCSRGLMLAPRERRCCCALLLLLLLPCCCLLLLPSSRATHTMKVLLCGAAGFTGRAILEELLAAGHTVRAWDLRVR